MKSKETVSEISLNPFPNKKNLDSFKLKEFADDNFRFDENSRKFFKRVENTAGKEEITPFPTMFSKDFYGRHIKTKACLGES